MQCLFLLESFVTCRHQQNPKPVMITSALVNRIPLNVWRKFILVYSIAAAVVCGIIAYGHIRPFYTWAKKYLTFFGSSRDAFSLRSDHMIFLVFSLGLIGGMAAALYLIFRIGAKSQTNLKIGEGSKIIITRKFALQNCIFPVEVFIDNQKMGLLMIGGKFEAEVGNQQHFVQVRLDKLQSHPFEIAPALTTQLEVDVNKQALGLFKARTTDYFRITRKDISENSKSLR
ncbi:MAG: hypothetical protein ACRC3B_01690 [Bacteroidia bacterium]